MRSFFSSRRSVWFVLYAFATPSILALTGASIDFYRLHTVKTRMINITDSAALAGLGVTASNAQRKDVADRYMKALMPKGYLQAYDITYDIQTESSDDNLINRIKIKTNLKVPMPYISLGGLITEFEDVSLEWTSSAIDTVRNLEVALVIDHSGSMARNDGCGGSSGTICTRMQAVKTVALDFIDRILTDTGTRESRGKRVIAVVPFAAFVSFEKKQVDTFLSLGRAGASDALIAAHSYGVRAPQADNNRPCLANRLRRGVQFPTRSSSYTYNPSNLLDLNDSLPDKDDPQSWFYSLPFYTAYSFLALSCNFMVSANPYGNLSGPVTPGMFAYQASVFNAARVMPLTDDKSILRAKIQGLNPSGETAILDAMKWGFRILSPKWRGVWLDPKTNLINTETPALSATWKDAGAVGIEGTRKVLILLTDGLQAYPPNSSYGFTDSTCGSFGYMASLSPQFKTDYENTGIKDDLCTRMAGFRSMHFLRGSLHRDANDMPIAPSVIPTSDSGAVVNYYLSNPPDIDFVDEWRQRLEREMCVELARNGVSVYTVGFRLSESQQALSIVGSCTLESNRFLADNITELREVFDRLAEVIVTPQRLVEN